MRWLVGNWQLKLISIVLTIALLAAVAFTQNPPTTAVVELHIAYASPPSSLVLVNPPTKIQVRVVGLSNSVSAFQKEFSSSPGARVDLTGLHAGTNQPVNAVVTASGDGISIQPSSMTVHVDLETMETVHLPVQVRVTDVNASAGLSVVESGTYATCGNDAVMCEVTVHAPTTLVSGLQAYLSYVDPQPNQAGVVRVPGLPIRFERHGKPVDLTGSNPQVTPNLITVQPTTATARVETQGGILTTTFPVFAHTAGSPACGFQVQGITYSPQTVTVTGPTEALASMQAVQLSAIDLSGLSGNETVTRALSLPSGVQAVGGTPDAITVSVSINQAFSCTPSTVGGTPTPQPVPVHTPTPAPTVSPTG